MSAAAKVEKTGSKFVAQRAPGERRTSTAPIRVWYPPDEVDREEGWTAIPGRLRKMAVEKKLRPGGTQLLILLLFAELQWGKPKVKLARTGPLSYDRIAEECGCKERMIRDAIQDLADSGIIAMEPAGQLYDYALLPDNWPNVEPWDSENRKQKLKKPPASTDDPHVVEKADQPTPPPVRWLVPRDKPVYLHRGGKPRPIPFPEPLVVESLELGDNGSAPRGVVAEFESGKLRITLLEREVENGSTHDPDSREANKERKRTNGESGATVPLCSPQVVENNHNSISNLELQKVFRKHCGKPLDEAFARRLSGILGDTPPERLAALIDTRAKSKHGFQSGMVLKLAEEAAAAWKLSPHAEWPHHWPEDPGGAETAEWRSSGNNQKMSYTDWLLVKHPEWRRR